MSSQDWQNAEVAGLRAALELAKAQIVKYEKALAFYANPYSWEPGIDTMFANQIKGDTGPDNFDLAESTDFRASERARRALEGK